MKKSTQLAAALRRAFESPPIGEPNTEARWEYCAAYVLKHFEALPDPLEEVRLILATGGSVPTDDPWAAAAHRVLMNAERIAELAKRIDRP